MHPTLQVPGKDKTEVRFFHRRPRAGFSFSIESIFADLRQRLNDKIAAEVVIVKCYNDGYGTKFINILDAFFKQGKGVNHITGEVHFLNLLMKKKNVLLTIHDCGMVNRKSGLAAAIVKWLYLKAPVAKAAYVTAVSQETKRQIVAHTGCHPDKISVIPVAVKTLFQPFPKAFNEAYPTILQIGTGYNKNLLRLIEALREIPCHLVIIGKLSMEQRTALQQNQIHFSNEYNLSDERLLAKYQECDLLAFVSTFEGFGMPIVEAQCVERVVITSHLSSMPEVAGGGACLVDPYDVMDIRKNILKIIATKSYRDGLLQKGRLNRPRFNGDTIAAQYFQLYKEISLRKQSRLIGTKSAFRFFQPVHGATHPKTNNWNR